MIDSIPCVQPANHEWLKILASSVAGLFAGVLASMFTEPIKAKIQWRVNMQRVEKALGFDFIHLYMGLTSVEHGLVPSDKFWAALSLPAFEHYWSKNREVFYDSFEISTLRLKCMNLMRLKENVAAGRTDILEAENTLREILKEVLNPPKKNLWQRMKHRMFR